MAAARSLSDLAEPFRVGLRDTSRHATKLFGSVRFMVLRALAPVNLYAPPGHFSSPIGNPKQIASAFDAMALGRIPESLPGITIDRPAMVEKWNALVPLLKSSPFTDSKKPGFRYAYINEFYCVADGVTLQAMIRYHRPKKIIEIGNGWSSACILDTVERYLDHCELTFIDPFPKRFQALAGADLARVRHFACAVQSVGLPIFDALEDNDILFIDSSHVLRTGSDVCFDIFEILPRLRSGVLVHIHDIFWPFEYPRAWAVDNNCSWNEIYAVRAFLMNNDKWEILLFNDYLAKLERPLIEASWPDFLRNSGGALWLRRK